jgi:hypothetical protein
MKDEITALICYGNSPISKAITLFTQSKITHVAFKVVAGGQVFIADSQSDGFRIRKYSTWLKKYNYKYDEFEIPVTYKNVKQNIYDHIDETPYDYRLFILRYPRHIISKLLGNKDKLEAVKNEDEKEICSESFSHCLEWIDSQGYLPVDCNTKILLEGWKKRINQI